MSRTAKLTPEVQEKIVVAIRAGNYIETAAAYAGIVKDTLYRWLRRGARGEGAQYERFTAAVQEALAAAEVRDVAVIARASEKEWTAAAWRLERRNPSRWGRTRERQGLEDELPTILGRAGEIVESADGAKRLTLTFDAKQLTPADLFALRQMALRAAHGPGLPIPVPPAIEEVSEDEPPVFLESPDGRANGHGPIP